MKETQRKHVCMGFEALAQAAYLKEVHLLEKDTRRGGGGPRPSLSVPAYARCGFPLSVAGY
jgi:hypothetical protein